LESQDSTSGDIVELHIFGDLILGLCEDNVIRVWNHVSREYHNTLGLDQGSSFTATHLLHPATYLNKILVASQQGSMQLWNIRSMYVFILT
jgi:U3 small nucleolar RNA-associated protein 21